MTFLDHFEELRRRILISIVAILITTLVALVFSDTVLNLLLIPSGGLRLKAFNLMDGFMIKFHISLYLGIATAFPIWAFQIYRFITPGLVKNERQVMLPALIVSSFLFALGVAFGYYLLREIIQVLILVFPSRVDFLPAADDYISFVIFFLVSCGLAFQLPILLTLLVQLNILSTTLLKKQRRIAYFILFVFAELITPVSDPIVAPMFVLVPLFILYEASIVVNTRLDSQKAKQSQGTIVAKTA
jgi:sec-independent protein translocase protein TatC